MKWFAVALVVGLSACAGGNATLEKCGIYDSALFTLAGLRHEGKLSAAQIAAVDQARALANPICMQASPPDTATTLATVQSAADKLSATLAGVR